MVVSLFARIRQKRQKPYSQGEAPTYYQGNIDSRCKINDLNNLNDP